MKMTIEIRALSQENYGEPSNPNWKPKQFVTLMAEVSEDTATFDLLLIAAIKDRLQSISNDKFRFLYHDHRVEIIKPVILEGVEEAAHEIWTDTTELRHTRSEVEVLMMNSEDRKRLSKAAKEKYKSFSEQ